MVSRAEGWTCFALWARVHALWVGYVSGAQDKVGGAGLAECKVSGLHLLGTLEQQVPSCWSCPGGRQARLAAARRRGSG